MRIIYQKLKVRIYSGKCKSPISRINSYKKYTCAVNFRVCKEFSTFLRSEAVIWSLVWQFVRSFLFASVEKSGYAVWIPGVWLSRHLSFCQGWIAPLWLHQKFDSRPERSIFCHEKLFQRWMRLQGVFRDLLFMLFTRYLVLSGPKIKWKESGHSAVS